MPSQLASVCTALPHIQILQPSDSSFAAKRETYFAAPTNNPAAIACPTSAEQVSDLIRYTKDFNVPFSVRTGGHDVYGRSVIRDALCIDMRAFNTITIATDRQTATIGGGVLAGPLQRALCKEGLTTPTGNVSDVGYVGWACGGGYGPLSGQFGLGVDQIRGTEIVDAHGEVRMATATELRGIRGAGGNFGIITSMEIKIYDVEKVLSGMIMPDTSAQQTTNLLEYFLAWSQVARNEGKLDAALYLFPTILNLPQMGKSKMLAVGIVWSSNDHERGHAQIEVVREALTRPIHFPEPVRILMDTIQPMTMADHVDMMSTFVAKTAWGGPQSLSYHQLDTDTLKVIGKCIQDMPEDPCTMLSVHSLDGRSPSVTDSNLSTASCLNPEARNGHFMLEIQGTSTCEEKMGQSDLWAKQLREELEKGGKAMKGGYVSLIGTGDGSLEDVYGENYDWLRNTKNTVDPDGVFKHCVPRLVN